MATEVSIAKDLSGSEALEAIVSKFRETLALDGRFHSHKAYRGFTASIHFKFNPAVGFTPPVDRTILVEGGDTTDFEESPTVDETISIPMRPPNQVRDEAGLAKPVLVTDGEGRTHEKWVNDKGKPPKNTVKGGGTGKAK